MSIPHIAGHLLPAGVQPTGVRDTELVATEQNRLPQALEDFVARPAVDAATSGAVTQLLGLAHHVVDNGLWEHLGSVFTADVSYTVADDAVVGLTDLEASLRRRDTPPSHHCLNTLIRSGEGGDVLAWSRIVTIAGDGTVASADAVDRIVADNAGLRIAHRVVQPRHGGTPRPDGSVTSWVA